MKNTWSYGETLSTFLATGESEEAKVNEIYGKINKSSTSFCVLETQREAWKYEVELLRTVLKPYESEENRIYFEFDLMRFSKRADVVLVVNGVLICLEFKTDMLDGEVVKSYTTQDKMQVMAYADEFAQFHSSSRKCPIVPVLVVPKAPEIDDPVDVCCENIFEVIRTTGNGLAKALKKICDKVPGKAKAVGMELIENASHWEEGEYETVPTIVQAADRLFENQNVEAITRSGTDVTKTMDEIRKIIRAAERENERVVCFVTGEPGAGKTLVGLKIAAEKMTREKAVKGRDDLVRKVLLSGNYPLVKVLKESLVRNLTERLQKCKDKVNKEGGTLTEAEKAFIASSGFEVKATGRSKKIKVPGQKKKIAVPQVEIYTINEFSDKGKRAIEVDGAKPADFKPRKFSKRFIESTVSSMIQLVSHFRRGWETSQKAPVENVFVFDESQRAWSAAQVRAKDKKTHKDQIERGWSEPRTLLEYLNRHGTDDWCVAVCLVGGGQDIHAGEAGIEEWYKALKADGDLSKWKICASPKTARSKAFKKTFGKADRVNPKWGVDYSKLHLSETVRSFKSKYVGPFINALIDGRARLETVGNALGAKELFKKVEKDGFPLYVSRDKEKALKWVLKNSLHGERRCGTVMSSRAVRLRRYGFVTQGMGFDEVSWFLDGPDIINSSCAMELAASEFKIQGLELDYVLMGWDGDFSYEPNTGKFSCRHFSKGENIWKSVARVSIEDDSGDTNGEKDAIEVDPRDKERHLKNAYRVLLTRARQGMVIYIPEGDSESATESNLSHENYDPTYRYLHDEIGIPDLSEVETRVLE